jgi:hypothetical protein
MSPCRNATVIRAFRDRSSFREPAGSGNGFACPVREGLLSELTDLRHGDGSQLKQFPRNPGRFRTTTPRSSAIRESGASIIVTSGAKRPDGPTSRTTFAVPAKGFVCRNYRGRTD